MRIENEKSEYDRAKNQYVESYYLANLSPEFQALMERARLESRKLNKEGISLSIPEAYLISELVRQSSSRNFIELGSLTGFSALFLLRGLAPEGRLFCFEKEDRCADILEDLFSNINFVPELNSKSVTVIRGDARTRLNSWAIPSQIGGVFIDANKAAYLDYLNWLEAHLPGRFVVIADNVFLSGAVWGQTETPFSEKQILVMNAFNKKLCNSDSYDSCFVGTSEGLLVARRKI